MTKTQIKNDTYVKEGVIVNTFVKDPLLEGPKAAPFLTPLGETYDTLVISDSNIDMPERVYEREERKGIKSILCI